MPEELTDYQRDVLHSAQNNSISLNAFKYVNPKPEDLQLLGQAVLNMLNGDGNLIEWEFRDGVFSDLHQKELIVRISQS